MTLWSDGSVVFMCQCVVEGSVVCVCQCVVFLALKETMACVPLRERGVCSLAAAGGR